MSISKSKIYEEVVNSLISCYLINSNIDYCKIFHDGNWEYIWYTMSIQKTSDTEELKMFVWYNTCLFKRLWIQKAFIWPYADLYNGGIRTKWNAYLPG